MTKSSPLPLAEAGERLSVLFGHSIPHPSSWRRSSAVTNKWPKKSSSARQSRGKILAVPSYGIPPAGRNKGDFPGEISAALRLCVSPSLIHLGTYKHRQSLYPFFIPFIPRTKNGGPPKKSLAISRLTLRLRSAAPSLRQHAANAAHRPALRADPCKKNLSNARKRICDR
jgi:hypothetical protein